MSQQLSKDEWLNEIKTFSIKWLGYSEDIANEYRDCGGWDGYYEDDYSPEDAVREDCSYE